LNFQSTIVWYTVYYFSAVCSHLELWTMEERRNRADLFEVFKIAHGFSTISLSEMSQLDMSGRTRGHSLKLIKCRCNKDVRKLFSPIVLSKNGLCWMMILLLQRLWAFSNVNWKDNGLRRWVFYGLNSGWPWGGHCDCGHRAKYPASIWLTQNVIIAGPMLWCVASSDRLSASCVTMIIVVFSKIKWLQTKNMHTSTVAVEIGPVWSQ